MLRISGLLMAFLFIGLEAATAQENTPYVRDQPRFNFGLKAGLNITGAYQAKNNEFIASARPGFTTGVFLNFPVGSRIGIQPEVLYAQRSLRIRGDIMDAPYDLIRTNTRIDVPVLLTIKTVDILSIVAGPQFTHLIKQKDAFTEGTGTVQREEFEKDDIRKNIVGIIAGAQFNINPIIIDARIGWDIKTNTNGAVQTTPYYSFVWYQLTLGVMFN